MPRQAIATPELSVNPGFAHVVRAGDLLIVSGQVPVDRDGQLVGAGDAQAQVRQVFTNLGHALAAADAGFEDVVKLTVFAIDSSARQSLASRTPGASSFTL